MQSAELDNLKLNFEQDKAQKAVKKAKQAYEDALREANFGF
jgi:hypothetical protein